MRISYVSLVFLALLSACGDKPAQTPATKHVPLPRFGIASDRVPRGLWFTIGNYQSGGKLGRFDLRTGALEQSVRGIGADTQIFPDGETGLILLTRMGQDGVTLLAGADAKVSVHTSLPKMINPQAAVRDPKGRIWVSAQNSDRLLVLGPDLKEQAGVDLSALKSPTSTHADLGSLAMADASHLVVVAQRLDRSVATWKPDAKAGLARINVDSLAVEYAGLADVTNPIQIVARDGKVVVAGAGDLFAGGEALGRLATFGGPQLTAEGALDFQAKILAADLGTDGRDTLIVWYDRENRGCVQLGALRLVCAGDEKNKGYVFNAVKRVGNVVFASYVGGGEAELWVIAVDGSQAPRKIPMEMPIQSLSFGP